MSPSELINFSIDIRIAALRCIASFGQGHIGGSMSICDTLAVLYGGQLKHDPAFPEWHERDRLILSKGHAGPALYAALALRKYFPEAMLLTLNKDGTRLPSHVDRTKTPGVDMTCGSLGQGLSVGAGMAFAARIDKIDNYVFVILGDGECNEGQIWEAAGFASHHKLSRLIALVDVNKQQLDGYTKNVQNAGSIAERFAACGWRVINVDGHDTAAIWTAVKKAKEKAVESDRELTDPGESRATGKPCAIILDTQKGRGAYFAEGIEFNHSMPVSAENLNAAIEKLNAARV